jgi:hypothetical protein
LAWEPTYIKRVIANDIPTSTSPIFVETDRGLGYVKMPNSSARPQALVSELIGTQLAEWFGLQVFDYSVIQVAEADLDSNSADENQVAAFITREEKGNPWEGEGDTKALCAVENLRDFSWIVVFDTWIGNIDRHSWSVSRVGRKEWRNDRNVYLSDDAPKGKFTLKAYDHTHCQLSQIVASPLVDLEAKINDREIYGCFPEFKLFLQREEVQQACQKLTEMDDTISRRIVTAVPNEWIEDDLAQDRLIEFIKRRSQVVSSYIESTLFPQGKLFQ